MFSHTLATRKLHITKRMVELDNHICDSPAETHGYFFFISCNRTPAFSPLDLANE